jgi:RNA polymerase sigma-70 factor (ECF subfamily)
MFEEQQLIQEAIKGNTSAFDILVLPYLRQLKRWLEYVLDRDAEDCLQEVLLASWSKLPSLKDPSCFRSWLFQMARNKSLDFLRRRKRVTQNEIPLDLVEGYLSRQPEVPIVHAMSWWIGSLTEAERETMWLRYVDELSIDAIAKQRNVTTGTVKRLLHNARSRIQKNPLEYYEREEQMPGKRSILLPETRPTISIKPSKGVSFEVNLREEPWFFSVLETGEKNQWAIYDPPDWKRTYVYNMQVIGKAVVHGEEALETQVDECENGIWRLNCARHYTQLGDQFIKFLAVISFQSRIPHIDTFLDEQFFEKWGDKMPRTWKLEGRFQVVDETHLITCDKEKTAGVGYYDVTIGKRSFPCLRVLDTEWTSGIEGTLVEAYLTVEGRAVLVRRYNGKGWKTTSNWLKQVENNNRLNLDGVDYIHWYDCISAYDLG